MKEKKMKLSEALNYVRQRRKTARPNTGFMRQLKILDAKLYGSAKTQTIGPSIPSGKVEGNVSKAAIGPCLPPNLRKKENSSNKRIGHSLAKPEAKRNKS